MIYSPNIQAALRDAANNNVWDLVGTGAPTNGTSGTGVGLAGPGSTYTDYTNKLRYINTNTKASPTWVVIVDASSAQTLTNKTLTSPTISGGTIDGATITGTVASGSNKVLVANFTADTTGTGSTLTSLIGMSWTLVAGATYRFRLRGKVGMTTNGGLAMAFKYTTLTLTSILMQAIQRDATTLAVSQSTTTTDQTKWVNQKTVAYIDVELEGTLVVNVGGTLALQAAQNTSHADTTTVYAGFFGEFVRTL